MLGSFIKSSFFFIYLSVQGFSQKSGIATYELITTIENIERDTNTYNYPEEVYTLMDQSLIEDESLFVQVNFTANMSHSAFIQNSYDDNPLDFSLLKIKAAKSGEYCYDWGSGEITKYTIDEDEVFSVTWNIAEREVEITDEQKIINGYLCKKAIFSRIRNNPLVHDTIYTDVWFTEEINMPIGPQEFVGLPGTIVRVDEKINSYLLKVIQYDNGSLVECRSEGKVITKDDYEALMKERYRSFFLKVKNAMDMIKKK